MEISQLHTEVQKLFKSLWHQHAVTDSLGIVHVATIEPDKKALIT